MITLRIKLLSNCLRRSHLLFSRKQHTGVTLCVHLTGYHGNHHVHKTGSFCQSTNLLSPPCFPSVAGSHLCFVRSYSSEKHGGTEKDVSKEKKNKTFSSNESDADSISQTDLTSEQNMSVFQRFKKTYKEHGKILVCVHIATSVVWFGSFYAAARSGLDIVSWLEQLGVSETIIKPFKSGSLGYIAVAYLMYKLATPARYTVTLAGTNYAIKYLRKVGKMNPVPEGDRIRELYKDGKVELHEKGKELKKKKGIKRATVRLSGVPQKGQKPDKS